MNLEGKSAIVTGGSLGIGNAISLKLAEYGANVALNYRKHKEEADETIKKIEAMGRQGLAVQADVSNFADADRMVTEVISRFGRLDILVNNAGINWDGVIWKMTEEQWDKVLDINLKGYFNYVRAVSPHFREQQSGKIVNVTSINGMRGKFGQSNYSASKAGIIGLTKAVAKELGKYSVNVNAVAPGLIETDMMKDAPENVRTAALQDIVLNRMGQPDEVANVVVFLCSDLARHITGEVVKVDGGQYI
ncbi:MAG: beta-ketoacyl-ACP reductase [Ignavibacteria bacterium GWB2_35_12]|nr:MAG: beta-ketoacyl-ACP reductase [Ignavibacteria bacterium GWA2_35_8]OGU40406.1 MAG: beta-ketoacyl-ACP reductase [Ignavibacteria bacterium GWB2_35_12]OGU92199.1 MAG: beta-ketoacyl-ACP reductase [Ignavibacteria bacterium RIFOXYA2_FULL_35_10]OGV22542.1 MAG: beta-ketoacyl-ACP reductase [Ignavibacteria bacterium RIFOXYC2_FULL_35_21]